MPGAQEISVSPNDAETLLKNTACIQSKINEIVKAINKIAEVINGIKYPPPID